MLQHHRLPHNVNVFCIFDLLSLNNVNTNGIGISNSLEELNITKFRWRLTFNFEV